VSNISERASTVTSADVPAPLSLRDAKIALVHEWLVVPAGSEQVLREMRLVFPHADVFCLVDGLSDADRAALGVGHPRTSFLQLIPGVTRHYRALLPLMPLAIASLDLRAYDVVISNSHAVAKGGRPATTKLKVCSDQCNAFMIVGFAQLPCARQFPPT
jgi:hypothetical protein